MKDISEKAHQLIRTSRPGFQEAIGQAKENARQSRKRAWLPLSLEDFEDNPFLLYACLLYAYSERVEARMLPKPR